ncbi:MAG: sigma-70 family RNA polymerase sigma factor [Marinicella sp.]
MSLKERKFDALLGIYYEDLYRFAFWLGKDEHMAKDLVQEAYLRAWRAIDSLKDEKAAKSWIFTILRREFARQFDKKKPAIDSMDDMPFEIEDSQQYSPDDLMDINLTRQAMMNLDQKYAEPLMLQIIGGFSCDEIAEQLNISQSAVMTQLFRARKQLTEQMNRESKVGNKL